MRTSIVIAAGIAAVASAGTVTDTVDVTITSCEPTVTNCPYKSSDNWGDWTTTTTTTTTTTKPVAPASTWDPTWSDWTTTTTTTKKAAAASTWDPAWSDWTAATTVAVVTTTGTAACGAYTATAPPAWFSLLPSDELSSIQAQWTGAPPADWCYYTYSTSTLKTTPVAATATWPAGTTPVAAASSAAWASYA